LLIAAHADVNHTYANVDAAIHIAAYRLDYESVKVLIAAGADLNLGNARGTTPLSQKPHDAAMRKLLIEAGAK
jgi:ankyrin repeat protein